jgi:hypothetical protein
MTQTRKIGRRGVLCSLCYFEVEHNVLQVHIDDGATTGDAALQCTQKIGRRGVLCQFED